MFSSGRSNFGASNSRSSARAPRLADLAAVKELHRHRLAAARLLLQRNQNLVLPSRHGQTPFWFTNANQKCAPFGSVRFSSRLSPGHHFQPRLRQHHAVVGNHRGERDVVRRARAAASPPRAGPASTAVGTTGPPAGRRNSPTPPAGPAATRAGCSAIRPAAAPRAARPRAPAAARPIARSQSRAADSRPPPARRADSSPSRLLRQSASDSSPATDTGR